MGRGTINVPSWSPDSAEIAFVSYEYLPDGPAPTPTNSWVFRGLRWFAVLTILIEGYFIRLRLREKMSAMTLSWSDVAKLAGVGTTAGCGSRSRTRKGQETPEVRLTPLRRSISAPMKWRVGCGTSGRIKF